MTEKEPAYEPATVRLGGLVERFGYMQDDLSQFPESDREAAAALYLDLIGMELLANPSNLRSIREHSIETRLKADPHLLALYKRLRDYDPHLPKLPEIEPDPVLP